MTKNYSVRTDLALEERERFESDQVEISGVILEEDYDESSETRITRVIIETEMEQRQWENRQARI